MVLPDLPIIYCAGAFFGSEDPTLGITPAVRANIERARQWGAAINRTGLAYALVPHQLSEGMELSLTEEHWAQFTLQLVRISHAMFLIPGWTESKNTAKEWAEAKRLGLPWEISHSRSDLIDATPIVQAILKELAGPTQLRAL